MHLLLGYSKKLKSNISKHSNGMYELKQTGLGEKFKNNVEKKLLQISEQPNFIVEEIILIEKQKLKNSHLQLYINSLVVKNL